MSQSLKSRLKSSLSSTTPSGAAKGFIFVTAMWFLSRLVIVVAMELVAPLMHIKPSEYEHLPLGFVPGFVPKTSWELFSHWDGVWYREIATSGYEYANDGRMHTVAFFPLLPLLMRGLMTLGITAEVAGVVIDSLAFLGALLVLYLWVEEHHGIRGARWATAVLAWCPFSLFTMVIYTEGLFLLLTTASLRAFAQHQHGWAALWGAMATATRVTGAALVPAFLFVAWREKRPAIAYTAGLATTGGLLLFSLYCAIHFGDPLAFVHAQQGWQQYNESGWLGISKKIFANIVLFHFSAVIQELAKVAMVLGGGYLLWYLRGKLNRVVLAYGFCSLALILLSGSVMSVNRFAYGNISLSFALGVLLARHTRWGYAAIGLFAVILVNFAIRFAWWRWLA